MNESPPVAFTALPRLTEAPLLKKHDELLHTCVSQTNQHAVFVHVKLPETMPERSGRLQNGNSDASHCLNSKTNMTTLCDFPQEDVIAQSLLSSLSSLLRSI